MKKNKLILLTLLVCTFATSFTFAGKVSAQRQNLIDFAISLKGTKYVYGGKTPQKGFDCSGYVSYVANNASNIQIPPTSSAIYTHKNVTLIEEKQREPGDLMFFKTTSSGNISHVGIYLGKYSGKGKFNGKRIFIHAASDGPKTGVIISDIEENYWKTHFVGYGRILPKTK